MRSTKIKSLDGALIILPNGKLADSKIFNYHKPLHATRVTIEFIAKHGSDIEKVKKIVLDEIKNVKGVLKEPSPQIVFDELGDFGFKFRAFFWASSVEKKTETKEIVTTVIHNALK